MNLRFYLQGVKELSDELQRITLDLPYMGGYIPEAWLNYEKAILEYVL